MQPYDTSLPPRMIQDDLVAQSNRNEENLKLSVIKLNEVSGDYRSTLSLIDEKLIYLSAGSISLFLTFLGILFNSSRNTASLHYIFVFISIFAFLATIVLLLFARWFWSLFLFSIAHGHYLQNLKAKHETEVQMYRSGSTFISNTDYSQMSNEDTEKTAKKTEAHIKKIEKQIGDDKKKEEKYQKRAKILALLAYGTMVFAYVLASLFFIGLVEIMSK
jgi:hypothetical protein